MTMWYQVIERGLSYPADGHVLACRRWHIRLEHRIALELDVDVVQPWQHRQDGDCSGPRCANKGPNEGGRRPAEPHIGRGAR